MTDLEREDALSFAALLRVHMVAKPKMAEISMYLESIQELAMAMALTTGLEQYKRLATCVTVLIDIAQEYHSATKRLCETAQEVRHARQ